MLFDLFELLLCSSDSTAWPPVLCQLPDPTPHGGSAGPSIDPSG